MSHTDHDRRSRRSLLTAAVGGASVAAAATLARATGAAAGDTTVYLGRVNSWNDKTTIESTGEFNDGLEGKSNKGTAVIGRTAGPGTGVHGITLDGVGVKGEATSSGTGVRGETNEGNAVMGVADYGTGARGICNHPDGQGVHGSSTSGRGVNGTTVDGVGLRGSASGTGLALETEGPVALTGRSGVAVIPAGATSVTVPVTGGVTSGTFVLLTPWRNLFGRSLWFTRSSGAGTITIRLSSALTKNTKVSWLALEA